MVGASLTLPSVPPDTIACPGRVLTNYFHRNHNILSQGWPSRRRLWLGPSKAGSDLFCVTYAGWAGPPPASVLACTRLRGDTFPGGIERKLTRRLPRLSR